MAPAQSGTASEAEQKKRRACDECRTRKLACSKESDGCRRCKRDSIACIYSAQKQMGRPRKRPRSESEDVDITPGAGNSSGSGINDASTPTPTNAINQGDVGLFMLADQSSSPTELSFFDFLGVGGDSTNSDGTNNDGTNNDGSNSNLDSFVHQPNNLQTSPNTSSVPPIPSAASMSSMPGLAAPPGGESPTQGHRGLLTPFYPGSIFSVNFSNLDFSTNSIESLESSVPDLVIPNPTQAQSQHQHQHQHQAHHPRQRQRLSTSASSHRANVMSPTTSLTASAVSQTSASSSPAMVPNATSASSRPTLTPRIQSSSSHGSMSGRHRFSVLPPSPQLDTLPNDTSGQVQPQPIPMPTPSSFVPTTSTVDAYSKASAAWLLTAPNRVCGCLARLYLALDSLQHLPTQIGPAMSVARNAAHTAHDTILCPSCSPENVADDNYRAPPQSYQNLMVLGALLPSIARTYRRIVVMVDEETARASAAKIRLTISLTEYGGVWGHMARWDNVNTQTLTLDNSVVDPPLWRLVVRALLKMDVYGIHLDRADVDVSNNTDELKEGQLRTEGKNVGFASNASTSHAAEANAGSNKESGQHMMVPVHFGLKDIAKMMETRARMRHQWMNATCDAGLLGDTEGFTERLQPGEQYNCQRIFELAKHEIDQLVIV